ncbi:MAG: pyridoxamine 5'-phosphate oxidase family protein [Sphingobacteriales bacterium]|nr:pyridoxamine 5'-phosphate oxidase family protein [Sphingobacteriales bacterium]
MQEQTEFYLDQILKDCWQRLADGAQSPKHLFHFPVISTLNKDFPESRVVVLRAVNPKEHTLIFYSDVRSPKIRQIKESPNVSWVFYDAKSRIQIRIKAKAVLHFKDEISLEAWENSRLESKKVYLSQQVPSSKVDEPTDGLPQDLKMVNLTEENLKSGYENFVVVKTEVLELDWLFLAHHEHRRARFMKELEGFNMEWIQP